MRVEGGYGLHAPGLTFGTLGLRPGHHRLIGVQNQSGASVGKLNAVTAGFPHVEEERLIDRVLIRPVFDVDTFFEEEVGGFQNIFAGIGRKCQMMETTAFAGQSSE